MNRATWSALREYIQAESRLAALRQYIDGERWGFATEHEKKQMADLEAQVTRMETAVREALPER